MKILLTTLNAKFIHSSLALAYLKAYCQKDFPGLYSKEYTINEPSMQIIADIYASKPDVICFSCYIWNISQIRELCASLKQVLPDAVITAGGPEVSYDAESFLRENPAIDHVIRGEGEETLHELLQSLQKEEVPAQISGLTYRDANSIKSNSDRPLMTFLDRIPFPYKESIDDYKNRVIYYETSRGCPFNCSYCLSSTTRGVRYFDLKRVKKDLKFLMDKGIPEIKFVDRTFNCNEKRSRQIMEFLLENNIKTKFHFEIDAGLLSADILSYLENVPAGIFDFEIGIQSTYPQTLDAVNRTSRWDKQKESISTLLSNRNIHIHLDLIAGLPFEDYERFKISFNDVYQLKPHVIQLGFLKLLKGSDIREQYADHGYKFENNPPYQVLGNDYISYEQLLKLSQVEDLISRYYNTGMASNCLDNIIERSYRGNPFAFWESFADFMADQNFFRYGHKREEEYALLHDFVTLHENSNTITELLKLDFYLNNQAKNMPANFNSNNPDHTNELLYAFLKNDDRLAFYLPELNNKTPRERRRMVHLEYLLLNEDLSASDKPIPFIFIYDSIKKRAVSFDVIPELFYT